MNYVIHLTDNCNLKCKYCYENKRQKEISFDDIKLLIDNEIEKKSKNTFISFYGGEPLLKKELIYDTINYINSKESNVKFNFGITTNGTLLDEEFINYMKQNNFLNIAYSFDGEKKTQDLNRITVQGKGSFDIVEKNAKKLLKKYKDAVAMMVVTKNNINYLKDNLDYLINLGFKIINIQFDYLCDWEDEDLETIKNQYSEVAEIYYNKILKEEDLEIPAFDEKIRTHIENDYDCNKDCKLGMISVNVGTDGNFYPCMQFLYNKEFVIGNCREGIDYTARQDLIKRAGKENQTCQKCAINKRCKHTCACKNYLATKNINEISPIICELERIIIQASDKIAERLYKENSKMFLQKYYNKNYEVLKGILDYKK